jgi:hypothetical protein
MYLQPFLLGAGAQVTLKVAARMQSHAAPIGGRQERCFDLRKICTACSIIIVVEFALLGFAGRVSAVRGELGIRERVGTSDHFSRDHTFGATGADAVLYVDDLTWIPVV